MKKLPLLALLFAISISLTGCFDIVEEFTFNEDGSGSYVMKTDMHRLFEMFASFKSDSTETKTDKKNVDSTASLSSYVDTATALNAEEKKFFRNASLHVAANEDEKKLFFEFVIPFKTQDEFIKFYNSTPKAFENFSSKEGNDSTADPVMKGITPKGSFTSNSKFYDMKSSDGLFERKVRKEEMKSYFESDSTMKALLPFIGNSYSTTIIHLPKAAKSVSNPYATLSDDKKTVTLKLPISDYTERPEALNLKIEY